MTALSDISKKEVRPTTLVELLIRRSNLQPERVAFRFLENGEDENTTITYRELDNRVRSIAAVLQSFISPGERALLLYPPGLQFIIAFFACLYSGIIAIPAYPPDPLRIERTLPQLRAILLDAKVNLVLTTSSILSIAEFLFGRAPDLEALQWLATDTQPLDYAYYWKVPECASNKVAFLQYTSGSTQAPKGVMITHMNLLHNARIISNAFNLSSDQIGMVWLPPYHDMGLIGGIILPIYGGIPCILMSYLAFLQKPFRWLNAISRYKVTISGGPNFAYDLCVRKISDSQKVGLDLSSWAVAFIGAEPVRSDTIKSFTKAFAPCGFNQEAIYPCYGLAEATLMVSGGKRFTKPRVLNLHIDKLAHNKVELVDSNGSKEQSIVSCGVPLQDVIVRIVDPVTFLPCSTNEIGEIWISGPSIALGYWNREPETQQYFKAFIANSNEGPFLRTGDLGFIKDDELYITGRLKDLIIIDGLNHHPQDIEKTVEECHPSIRQGCCAAFSMEVNNSEQLVILVEIDIAKNPGNSRIGNKTKLEEIENQIRKSIANNHNLHVYDIRFLKPKSIIKTASEKIRRHACKEAYLKNALEELKE